MDPARRRDALAAAGLLLATVAAFAPALSGGIVYDDHALLGPTSVVRGPLWRIWLSADAWDYWPLTWSSLWVEWRLWGEWAPGFHAVNVALHGLAAVLLWRVLGRLGVPGAWLGALLFAVHPVAVESVAWISERKNVLSGALALAAALAWLRAREPGAHGRAGRALPAALFALALLAKTSAVMLPVALAGVLVARGERLDRRAALDLAPLLALSLAAGLVTIWFQHTNAMGDALRLPRGPLERAGDAAFALASYVRTAFFPLGVAVTYPELPSRASAAYLAPVSVVVASAIALAAVRSPALRPARLTLGYHAIMVLPVLGLVEMAYHHVAPTANHLQYLALPAPAALAGWAVARLRERGTRLRLAATALAFALALGCGVWTSLRATAYASDLALWKRAAAEAPDALFSVWMYADQLGEAGRVPEALAVLARTAEGAGDPVTRLRARALWLVHQGRSEEAVAAHLEAEQLRPSPEFAQELGMILLRSGEPALAARVLAPVAAAFPAVPAAAYWHAMASLERGDAGGAEAALRDALARRPDSELLREGLALVFLRTGRRDAAREALAPAGPGSDPAAVEARLARIATDGWTRGQPTR